MFNSHEVEKMLKDYYENKGYEVYTMELWFESCLSKEGYIFVDIECGGSYDKYFHIHGYKTDDAIQRILDKINLKLGVDVLKIANRCCFTL